MLCHVYVIFCFFSSGHIFRAAAWKTNRCKIYRYESTVLLSVYCCCSVAKCCPILCDPMNCSMPGFPVLHYLWSLLKLMYIESMMPSNHLILCYPLLFLPSVLPSIRVFFNELALHLRWPKYWSFNISPSREYSGLISFRIDWLISFLSKGLSKSFLLCCNSKALIFQCSAFFMVQLSHPYMTTGEMISLTIWTFVRKVVSLLLTLCLGSS